MKHIISILSVICLLFSLSSCEEDANMSKLISYQNGDFSAEAAISYGDKSCTAEIEKRGERLTFRFKKPEKLAAFSIVFTPEGTCISAEGTEIPLYGNSRFKASLLETLFTVQTEGAWKIKRSAPGGVDVYICISGDTVLYIDANSHTPLKLCVNGITADIVRFSAK